MSINEPLQNDLELLYMFLSQSPSEYKGSNTVGAGALRLDLSSKQLYFCPGSKKGTLILLGEWVDSVLLVRNWKRDRGSFSRTSTGRRTSISYSMADYAGSILYFLESKPSYRSIMYIEVKGPIKQEHRDQAKLLSATLVL